MVSPATTSAMVDAALCYAARGWRVIPLYGVRGAACACRQGKGCPTPGKHPPLDDWATEASTDSTRIRTWWQQRPGSNIGLVTGVMSGIVVIDTDPRHGGDINLEELQYMYAVLPETPKVLTGGGGTHDYFACTEALPSCDLAGGIQFQTERHLVVAPPSLHASGKSYAWEVSLDPEDTPLAPLPAWVRALALAHEQSDTDISIPDLTQLPEITMQTLKISARMKYVIQTGQDPDDPEHYRSRSEALFGVIQSLISAGYDDATIAAVVLNKSWRISEKPWGQRDPRSPRYEYSIRQWVGKELLRARAKHQLGRNGASLSEPAPLGWSGDGVPAPPSPRVRDPAEHTDWYAEQVRPFTNKRDIVSANNTTIMAFLQNHSFWQGKFWWDAMASKPMFEDHELSDHRITQLGAAFGTKHHLPITNDLHLARCLAACCHLTERDPLQEWLQALPGWDGTPRLEDWLSDYAGVTYVPYHRFVSHILIVSMIARAFDPGCLYRNVIIFEGPEEYRKSSFVAALVPYDHWHTEMTCSFDSKDAPMMVQGLWVAELSELDSLSRTEETRLKAFISARADAYIPKFKIFRTAPKRRTIFVGTTNESTYLKGTAGNTRFLPVQIAHPIDVEGFLTIREQLFAEAMVYYGDHCHDWWAMPDDVTEEAVLAREQRRQVSIYELDLGPWLDTGRFHAALIAEPPVLPVHHETSWAEIAAGFLRLDTPEKWKDINLQKQIAQALKALGWTQRLVRRGDTVMRLWVSRDHPPF